MTSPIDTTRCPLCGQPNACAMACPNPPDTCWCVSVTFTPDLLARVPEALQRQACICRACAQAALTTAAPPHAEPQKR